MSYDSQGRLATWESQPTSPAQTASYLYDGSGKRIAMLTSVNGTSTLTAYIGSIEQVQTTGSTKTTTTYYAVQGKRIAANVNGTFYYFGYDALGSQVVVLNSSGNLIGSQLYGPYGNPRYSTGTLPTSIGFTGQQADSVTGLDYYVVRYYDPVVGQFLSVDTVQGNAQGTSPYVYVAGNPETRTDPTGQRMTCGTPECSEGGSDPNPDCFAADDPCGLVSHPPVTCDQQCQGKQKQNFQDYKTKEQQRIHKGQQHAQHLATNEAQETFHNLAIIFGAIRNHSWLFCIPCPGPPFHWRDLGSRFCRSSYCVWIFSSSRRSH